MLVEGNAAIAAKVETKITGYTSRWQLLTDRCRGRRVLHLGCIGETDRDPSARAEAFGAGLTLHSRLLSMASQVDGVDIDKETIELLRNQFRVENLIAGDAERLESLALEGPYEVVLCGDLIEHLSCPGRLLDGIHSLMARDSELLVSVPNAFGLLANLRMSLGTYREGHQHVLSFSKFTIVALLKRHGFQIKELYSVYDRPPISITGRLNYMVGIPLFRLIPERGGTLLAIAALR